MFFNWYFGIPFCNISLLFDWLFTGLKKLEEGRCTGSHVSLFWRWFLTLGSIDPRNILLHSHSSLLCKIKFSFSAYSEWVNRQYVATLRKLTATGKQFRPILAAHSIATTLKYWYHGSPPGEIVSLGVLSEGKPGLFVCLFILYYFKTSMYASCFCFCVPAFCLHGL